MIDYIIQNIDYLNGNVVADMTISYIILPINIYF